MLSNYLMKRAAAHGRSRRFTRQIEWRLCEPLLTNPLEAAKRRFVLRFQLVDATHWLNRSAGVSKFNVSLGLSLRRLATAFSLFW